MATAKKKTTKESTSKSASPLKEEPVKKLKTQLEERYTPHAIFVLCGPIGSPIHEVGAKLQTILLSKYGYTDCEIIRIGKEIPQLALKFGLSRVGINKNDRYTEVVKKIDMANQLRKKFGNSILAEFAIDKIKTSRSSLKREEGIIKTIVGPDEITVPAQKIDVSTIPELTKERKVVYIIDSIKNQEELDVLRLVYRDLLFFIGVFSPLNDRIAYLKRELSDDKGDKINKLIDKDSGEELEHGITVEDTFPKADFFIRVSNGNFVQIEKKLERFLDLVFDKEVIVPTYKETAMYQAASAAKNSACLSRQVGASLTDEKGEILSLGWNDVPKTGGDLYKSSLSTYGNLDNKDHRCMNIYGGQCFNDINKNAMVDMIYNQLKKHNLLTDGNSGLNGVQKTLPEDIRDKLTTIESITKYVLKKSKIRSLVEFSRSIHAEMHAIIMGSQSAGHRVKNGRIFITTYPCHMCARHIIVAGIKDVYYIEPYRKSLTIDLHYDSITENEDDRTKVRILLFEGVGPNRYFELFDMPKQRKQAETGKKKILSKFSGMPKTTITLNSIPEMEKMVTDHYNKHVK